MGNQSDHFLLKEIGKIAFADFVGHSNNPPLFPLTSAVFNSTDIENIEFRFDGFDFRLDLRLFQSNERLFQLVQVCRNGVACLEGSFQIFGILLAGLASDRCCKPGVYCGLDRRVRAFVHENFLMLQVRVFHDTLISGFHVRTEKALGIATGF